MNPNDSANFLELLKEIRASPKLARNLTLTAATSITPFVGPDGNPVRKLPTRLFIMPSTLIVSQMANVSEFAKYLDYVEVMNYDVWGSWSLTAGPNAPLNDTCAAKHSQKVGSAVGAIAAWTGAGFPADQIVLGVAAYGHSFSVNHTEAFGNNTAVAGGALSSSYPSFNASNQPSGDLWDDQPGVDVCGVMQGQGYVSS